MKEYVRIVVELEPAEEEAFDLVLDTLERMIYIYEEKQIDEIFLVDDLNQREITVIDGLPQRAIQALEEILGTWA